MAYESILYDVKDKIATITLNRPKQLNAMSGAVKTEIKAAIGAAVEDENVHVIVLTGTGKALAAGNDLQDNYNEPPKCMEDSASPPPTGDSVLSDHLGLPQAGHRRRERVLPCQRQRDGDGL